MKKNLLLSFMLTLVVSVGLAQTEKGTWTLSGKTGMNFTHSFSEVLPRTQPIQTSTTVNQFSVNPSVGYFVADNLAVNLSSAFEYTEEDGANATQVSVLPGLIYYIPTQSQLRPFVQAGAGYGLISTKDSGQNTGKLGGFAFGGAAGVSYFINRYISIDLSAQYMNMDLKDKDVQDAKLKVQGITGMIGFSLFL